MPPYEQVRSQLARAITDRDLAVEVPGHGRDKINSAFENGGEKLGKAVWHGFQDSITSLFGDSWDFLSKGSIGLDLGLFHLGEVDARANCGPVTAGQSYVVGEKRPELFVPSSNGYILPSVPSGWSGPPVLTIWPRAARHNGPRELRGGGRNEPGEAVDAVALYRGALPAQFGGRISSVLDVKQQEGSYTEIKGNGGIGVISGRLALEGPIIQDKTSFLIAGRSSYSDWLLRKMPDISLRNSRASFYTGASTKGRMRWPRSTSNTPP